jgi:aldose 1-epimerase
MINADDFTPITSNMVPTGELMPVKGTPFDFTSPVAPRDRIEEDHLQLELGGGFDHNWVLRREGEGLELAATVYEPISGRYMEVLTEEPGIQYYSGNFLDGSLVGKSGVNYEYRSGFCLETQHYPDSPNHANFPSTTLKPGEIYKTRTVYRFSVR